MIVIILLYWINILFLVLQSVLHESRELHGDLESMQEKVELLSECLQVEGMGQQVAELSRHTEELEQAIKSRLQSLQEAATVSCSFLLQWYNDFCYICTFIGNIVIIGILGKDVLKWLWIKHIFMVGGFIFLQ